MQRKTLLLWGKEQLNDLTNTAYLEATTLLCFTLKCSHTDLLAHPHALTSQSEAQLFQELIERRSQNEPIAYLTGECEFWSLSFKVTPACLIPREETEILVEQVLATYPKDQSIRLVDLGTGSGAIAITLSLERPHWQIIATDQSTEALKLAQENTKRLGAHVTFQQGDWFEALSQEEPFDVIISNPPYLAAQDRHLNTSLRYEPQQALIGGPRGDEILEHLIQQAPSYLTPCGQLWLEQGFDQGDQVQAYFEQYGYTAIQKHYDLAGIHRITRGTTQKYLGTRSKNAQ